MNYQDVFGAEGPLARAIPGYAFRSEQSAMAAAVGRALTRGEPLIVEAGTGTGKTFAYLVPALLSGLSVIISTGTRTLQDQLFHRDVPLLARALGMPVKMALLKGRANYLCRHRLELASVQRSLFPGERGSARLLARVSRWAAVTKSGDLAELTELPEQSPVWPMLTSTRENCLGQECPQFSRCHVMEARRAAQAAQVVVVNHHLLLADLALKDEGFGDLLPGAQAVILDEAHQVPDIAAQFFGQTWSVRQVQLLMRDAAAEMNRAGVRAPAAVSALGAVESLLEELRSCLAGAGRHEWANLPDTFFDALPALNAALGAVATELEGLGAGAGTANCARRAAALASALETLSEMPEEAGIRWVDANPNGMSLQFTPFEIAERLRGYVDARPCSWVFTSATLAIGEDFAHFAARIGLPEARTLKIDSPFDYRRQARIYLPRGMPEPQHPSFARKFIDACAPLIEASGGRAFLLVHQLPGVGRRGRSARSAIPRAAVSRAGAGAGAARSSAAPVPRARQRRAARHRQLLGRRGCEGRGAVHRRHRQAALRLAGRSAAQGAPGGHSPPRRQSLYRVPAAPGGAGAEAGCRAPDPRCR